MSLKKSSFVLKKSSRRERLARLLNAPCITLKPRFERFPADFIESPPKNFRDIYIGNFIGHGGCSSFSCDHWVLFTIFQYCRIIPWIAMQNCIVKNAIIFIASVKASKISLFKVTWLGFWMTRFYKPILITSLILYYNQKCEF